MRLIIFSLFFLSACQLSNSSSDTSTLGEQLDQATFIDLTHTLNTDAPFWSGENSPFEYSAIATHESGKVIMGRYAVPEHFGTHLDAPIHGGDHLSTVDELTANDLFGPAVVIDISQQSNNNADYLLTVEDILTWESDYGLISEGAIILLNTGWGQKWGDVAAYRNRGEDGKMHFPGFSVEAADFLVNQRTIKGIGIDNMSVDYGLSSDFAAHGIVNGSGKYHLENVANVHLLPATGSYLFVAPIKLGGGSGGQVRIWAMLP